MKNETLKIKQLFEICEKVGEGIHGKAHVILTDDGDLDKCVYRIYHADGYCIDVSRELVEDTGEFSKRGIIDNYYYSYMDESYEGFKPATIDEAIKLFQ